MLFTHKIIYRQILHRLLNCGEKMQNFPCDFFSQCLKTNFVLVITLVIKFPDRKIKKPSFRQMEKHDKTDNFFDENSLNTKQARVWNIFRQSGGQEIGEKL